MSDVEWDADDFVPSQAVASRAVTDKWEGEDEEAEVKNSWDSDEETKTEKENNQTSSIVAMKKKKKLTEILAEKEKKMQEEIERRQKEREEERKNRSSADLLEEKLRLQKIQQDSDLQLATDLLVERAKPEPEPECLEGFDLSTSSGLNEFRLALIRKIKSTDRMEKKPFYVTFVEDLCRDLCNNLETEDIKRVTTILNATYNEKIKASKPVKRNRKASGKAKMKVGRGAIDDDIAHKGYEEYDDFI